MFDTKAIQDQSLSIEEEIRIEQLISCIDDTVTQTNDQLRERVVMNPLPLAEKMWQVIWVQTGKIPEKCLYNVVELFVFKFLSDLGVLSDLNNWGLYT